MAEWGDIKFWDTSLVTSFENAFTTNRNEAGDLTNNGNPKAATFNAPLLGWDTAKVKSLVGFLSSATSFNGDISAFDTRSVTSMANAFKKARKFNGDLSKVSFFRSLRSLLAYPLISPTRGVFSTRAELKVLGLNRAFAHSLLPISRPPPPTSVGYE